MAGRVIVYGGAGALGSKVVEHFAARNWWTCSIDLLKNDKASCNIVVNDSTDFILQGEEVVSKVTDATANEKVDAILCLAGGWTGGSAKKKDFFLSCQQMWKQSVWTSVISCRLGSLFLKTEGLLVFTGAAAALQPTPTMMAYGMAKAAVQQLARSAGCPAGGLPEKSTCLAILPVTLDTPANRKAMPKADTSSWTQLSYIVDMISVWISDYDSRPKSGSLIKLTTVNGNTKSVTLDTLRCFIIRRCSTFVQKSGTAAVSSENGLVIPDRIPRSHTDLLKSLASTVKDDPTAGHYAFMDDPYLIPSSNAAKKSYLLGKYSGKNAARYFAREFPTLFMLDYDEPRLNAFRPQKLPVEENGFTEEDLIDRMRKIHVQAAIVVYENAVKKRVQISQETLLAFLEFLCYYNATQPNLEISAERRWFESDFHEISSKNWKDRGLAEKIFQAIQPETARAYAAIITGLLKYNSHSKAEEMFRKMKEASLKPDIDLYNAMLDAAWQLRTDNKERWQYCLQLLNEMRDDDIQPDVQTFNTLLWTLKSMRFWKFSPKHAMEVYQEMLHLDLEPTLATYLCLVEIFFNSRDFEHLTEQIISRLRGKSLKAENKQDELFFPKIMQRCCENAQSVEIADCIHEILTFENNAACIVSFQAETVYYENYLTLVARHGSSFEEFFKYYDRFVPRNYSPNARMFRELLHLVDSTGSYEHLTRIWSEMLLHGYVTARNDDLLLELLTLVTSDFAASSAFERCKADLAKLSWNTYNSILNSREKVDANVMALLSLVSAQTAGNEEEAWKVIIRSLFFALEHTVVQVVGEEVGLAKERVQGKPSVDVLEKLLSLLNSTDNPVLYKKLQNMVESERKQQINDENFDSD
ncbi:Protein PTCD3 -like protein, mitochondrial [Trichinella pseudospiralis]|uniref:Dihydropteridine reductase n=1 Tax=Trichinella pseudospiralis TaxID=6337 RepID=A0A0V1JJ36_TRIPS|nr:Protein PTCD3 -like protein, mitochondrial [Trichinella pseudospiralis]KRY76931.1 Protein PTCD3 -like protein, mitochondrial [Trichinella pseudospiralis]KRZ34565.1 Protein PTCD3 -like protein, mitochondrial [Trichinella pseudospiralis]KRZ34566.1 Protein PTCD3 -like protein, mitochondrial [Trichinella pseudospiralis]